MLKSIFTAAVLAATSFVATPAQAADCKVTDDGWLMCIQSNGHLAVDVITVKKGNSQTRLEVICDGKGGNVWESYGTWEKAENQKLANGWCDDYRN